MECEHTSLEQEFTDFYICQEPPENFERQIPLRTILTHLILSQFQDRPIFCISLDLLLHLFMIHISYFKLTILKESVSKAELF